MNILCFGEPLIRLATTGYERLEDAHNLEVTYGGGETVVAASLASQGENVAFASKVSANRLGTNSLMMLARCGVDTSRVLRSNERMGLYYSERGRSIRPSIVTYDRSGTAMAMASHTDFDWDRMLNGVDLFFFSGITPAISEEMYMACKEGLYACRGRGIHVVCDLNYRSTMLEPSVALERMHQLLLNIDELIASEDDILSITSASISRGETFDYCHTKLKGLFLDYPLREACFVVRQSDRYDFGSFRGALLTRDGEYLSKTQRAAITDLSSSGSIFAASMVHAQCCKWDPQFCIDYATMASAYKATVAGDLCFATETELASLLADTAQPSIRQ